MTGASLSPSPPIPCASTRFTLDGSEELENHLARICKRVLAEVLALVSDQNLEALLLGGGYGRGEGGVLKTEAGDRPYNDLEFYICLRGNHWRNERRYVAALHSLAESLTPVAGVDVEFKLLSLGKLRRSPPSMFYYDLMRGHRRLWGEEALLAQCAHHCAAERIPLPEATRLLMNRCSGLLLARQRLHRPPLAPEDADFVGRNLAKAQLALGDVLLTMHGQYHWSCLERARRLELFSSNCPHLPEIHWHHRAGVEFKLHPCRAAASLPELRSQHEELRALALELWLWLETRRLHRAFANPLDYALDARNKCPETHPCRNYLVNLKAFGPASLLGKKAYRHPRQRVLQGLSILLWSPQSLEDPRILQQTQRLLGTSSRDLNGLLDAYHRLWRRFN